MILESQPFDPDEAQHQERLERYLTVVLHRDVSLRIWTEHQRLPIFLVHLYRFFETRIGRMPLLFMAARQRQESTPAEVQKHLNLVRSAFDGIVAYSTDRTTAGFRARLVATGVAFAVPGNQLYIPELATDLREHFRSPETGRPDRLSPATQLLLFHHLMREERGKQSTPTELAQILPYSIMTTSRAFDELVAAELARVERRGRKKLLTFRAEGHRLIDKAKKFLVRPERHLVYCRWVKEPPALPLAGEHALASLSDLAVPSAPPVYAVSSEQMKLLLASGLIEPDRMPYDSDAAIGMWRYDPEVLARSHVVDPLSLYAQFWDHPDERVSLATDRLIKQWTE